jgi:hypothetical protein
MAIPALLFPSANNRGETWVATITPDRVKLWRQDEFCVHLELSKEDLLQILAVLNGAARSVEAVRK